MNADKHFLTCEHCGFDNEVNSEYLVFCGNCNKKMKGSFAAWKIEHPGKPFEDYLKAVCHTKPAIAISVDKNSSSVYQSRRYVKILLLALSVVIIVGVAGYFIINQVFYQTLEKYTKTEWTLQSCGGLGLRLFSPVVLNTTSDRVNELPEEAGRVIIEMESYMNSSWNKKLFIKATSFRYNPQVSVSLNRAVEASIREAAGREDISGFTYDITNLSYYEIPGRLITGRWLEGRRVIGYQTAIFTQGSFLWHVHVAWDYHDPFGEEIASRIIHSVMINMDMAYIIDNNF